MIPSFHPDILAVQRGELLAEIQANEDWALLNNMGALPTGLGLDLTHEKINEGIVSEGDTIMVFIKHKTTGSISQENGTNVMFERHADLPEDKSQWPEGQEDSLFDDAWGTGYAEQQILMAEVKCLDRIKNAIS